MESLRWHMKLETLTLSTIPACGPSLLLLLLLLFREALSAFLALPLPLPAATQEWRMTKRKNSAQKNRVENDQTNRFKHIRSRVENDQTEFLGRVKWVENDQMNRFQHGVVKNDQRNRF